MQLSVFGERLRRSARRVYLANVGVNLSHSLRSPLFADNRFEFVPIPEGSSRTDCVAADIQPVTYEDLSCYNSTEKLLSFFSPTLQAQFASQVVHYDPNLDNANDGSLAGFTYGDIPYVNARASSLRHAQPGDLIFFIANLSAYDGERKKFLPGQRSLYLIGFLEIDALVEYTPLNPQQLYDPYTATFYGLHAFARNAHVNHLLTLPHRYASEPFTIFEGSPASMRFVKAVPITLEMCNLCLRDKRDQPFTQEKFKSVNACIGAYTRAVRHHFDLQYSSDQERFAHFLRFICTYNTLPDALAAYELALAGLPAADGE
jgi:hypothetical protein